MGDSMTFSVTLSDREARHFSQFIRRASNRRIGPLWRGGLDLVTEEEEPAAEIAIYKVRDALAAALAIHHDNEEREYESHC